MYEVERFFILAPPSLCSNIFPLKH